MADDFLGSFLDDGGETQEPEVVEQQEAEAIQPEQEQQTEVIPEPVVEQPKSEHIVSLESMLGERDRRKAAEAERDELRRKWEAQEQSRQAKPDAFDDPEGYTAYLERGMEERLTAVRYEMSERFAKQTFGEDATKAALEWAGQKANTDPTFAAQYHRESDPIGWIVQQHKRDALVSQLPTDVSSLDELIEREIAKRGLSVTEPATTQAVVTPQPAKAPAMPPRSIASEASVPKDQAPTDDKAGFLAAFK